MMSWEIWGAMLLVAAAFVSDSRRMRIPNWMTVPSMLAGLLVHWIAGGSEGLLHSLGGAGTGLLVMLLLYVTGAVGAGDVKLFAGIGAWIGAWYTLQAIMYSILFAALIGCLIMLYRRESFRRLFRIAGRLTGFILLRNLRLLKAGDGQELRFPFMYAVLPGMLVAVLYQ